MPELTENGEHTDKGAGEDKVTDVKPLVAVQIQTTPKLRRELKSRPNTI